MRVIEIYIPQSKHFLSEDPGTRMLQVAWYENNFLDSMALGSTINDQIFISLNNELCFFGRPVSVILNPVKSGDKAFAKFNRDFIIQEIM